MVNTKKSAVSVALKDLKRFQLAPKCVEAFAAHQAVWCSERFDLPAVDAPEPLVSAAAYDAENPHYLYYREVQKALSLARDAGCFPYHVVQVNTGIGNLFAVLYTTDEDEEPEPVNGKKYVYEVPAFVYNATQPNFSEFGFIWVKPQNGALLRVS